MNKLKLFSSSKKLTKRGELVLGKLSSASQDVINRFLRTKNDGEIQIGSYFNIFFMVECVDHVVCDTDTVLHEHKIVSVLHIRFIFPQSELFIGTQSTVRNHHLSGLLWHIKEWCNLDINEAHLSHANLSINQEHLCCLLTIPAHLLNIELPDLLKRVIRYGSRKVLYVSSYYDIIGGGDYIVDKLDLLAITKNEGLCCNSFDVFKFLKGEKEKIASVSSEQMDIYRKKLALAGNKKFKDWLDWSPSGDEYGLQYLFFRTRICSGSSLTIMDI